MEYKVSDDPNNEAYYYDDDNRPLPSGFVSTKEPAPPAENAFSAGHDREDDTSQHEYGDEEEGAPAVEDYIPTAEDVRKANAAQAALYAAQLEPHWYSVLVWPWRTYVDPPVLRWLHWWHGHGEAHQFDYYRCHGCQRIVTWHAIRKGGCPCKMSAKLSPALLSRTEKVCLLLFPWWGVRR